MKLHGEAALVSGGGSGLGAATAAHLARLGCRVALLDINQTAAEYSARRFGGLGLGCDVSDGPMPLAAFERVVRVNLVGTFNMIRLAAADMATLDPLDDDERGVIVNTASIAAYEAQVGQSAYAASKAGVVGLTLTAARELAGLGIRVVSIAPGLFETPMVAALPPEVQQSLGDSVPYPARLGHPEEFAALVEHIAANHYLNGETIRLDGALRKAPR